MKTVHEVSELTGVSVRTLHHYDSIGLLKPSKTTEAGYRLYDDTALCRLQTILLFRELEFPLKEIKQIIDSSDFDRKKALAQQVKLLELRQKRLKKIITFAREIITTGVDNMSFSAFDDVEIKKYAKEAKAKWGETQAYKESENKAANRDSAEDKATSDGIMQIFADMGKINTLSPESAQAQASVEKLRLFISENYYSCTPQILCELGKMYTGDERFKINIDNFGGVGTADFASKAIEFYCNNCSE